MLFVLIMLAHERRRIVHVAVTEHPTTAWTAQQFRNAFPNDEAPAYLLHDRDAVLAGVATSTAGMHIQAIRTAPPFALEKRLCRDGLFFPERRAGLLESQRPAIDDRIRMQRPDAAADHVGRDRQRPVPRGYANVDAAAGS